MSFLAVMSVFFKSMATVIGPTPPGTGVIKPAFFFTSNIKRKKYTTVRIFPNNLFSKALIFQKCA